MTASTTREEAVKSRRLLVILLAVALVLSLASSLRSQTSRSQTSRSQAQAREIPGASRSTTAVLTSPPQ